MCFGARSFRPLTGKLVLILISDDYWPTLRWSCFRPLTGKLVLIICVVYVLMAIYAHAFPSPYGEVGFDPIENAEAIDSREIEFPSPYGEVGFDLLQVLSDLSLRRHEFPSPYGEVGFDRS